MSKAHKPHSLPVLVTRGLVTFPGFDITIEVGRDVSLEAIRTAQQKFENQIIIVSQKNVNGEIEHANMYNFGILAKIVKVDEDTIAKTMYVTLIGLRRVTIANVKIDKIVSAEAEELIDVMKNSAHIQKMHETLIDTIKNRIARLPYNISKETIEPFLNAPTTQLIDAFAFLLPLKPEIKNELLGEKSIEKRMNIVLKHLLSQDNSQAEVAKEVNDKVRNKLSDQQREFYLREQLKQIKEELNEISGNESEIEGYKKRIDANPYPKYIKDKLTVELRRLENTPSQAQEANVIRTYIEWLLDLPYWQKTEEKVDIKKAKKILDKHHYGLEKVKERIVEYLAVKEKNPNSKGTILCLVGAPGTGKTSLVKSIAESLGRKMIKVSLGGIRDEAEIRGHRRTYIAAMPGKIIQGMKKAGVTNPVMLLDELDKMSSDFKGDPASAMLEVLDYEQNRSFQDHFIEEEYDLSNVMFIATANYLDKIPHALYDRLEFIEVSPYTEIEKINIAEKHLLPRVLEETKLEAKNFELSPEVVKFIIRHYTMEAGVRQLYRMLEALARKILVLEFNGKLKKNFEITTKSIIDLLGKQKFDFTKKDKEPQIGTVTGLAWTAYGGDILPIEVTMFHGKGDVILTGQQKDIMKESATIALSFVKSNAEKFGIDSFNDKGENIFKTNDFHIHVPDGATPKDGPSAGITFTTALISALSKRPISQLIGMTGEITLRGNVLPIGGLKEKSISAYRSGLETIYIPKENERDLPDLPKEVKDNLKIVSVEKYEELYKYIFKNSKK